MNPGERVGPYEILSRIGQGGMGAVYKARDTRFDRTVAIKKSGAAFSERFEREAQAIAALNHPYLPTLRRRAGLPGDGAGGRKAAGWACARSRGDSVCDSDRGCAGCGASQGDHASRSEAGEYSGNQGGGKATRLWTGQARCGGR